jgi:peptidoglycan/LPS O-acetylase OafA/YrhL
MSYCFYLVHHIFVIRLAQPGVRALGVDGLLALAIALAMGLFAAWALHRFVEKPMEKVLSGRISVTDAAPNLPEKTISEPS